MITKDRPRLKTTTKPNATIVLLLLLLDDSCLNGKVEGDAISECVEGGNGRKTVKRAPGPELSSAHCLSNQTVCTLVSYRPEWPVDFISVHTVHPL